MSTGDAGPIVVPGGAARADAAPAVSTASASVDASASGVGVTGSDSPASTPAVSDDGGRGIGRRSLLIAAGAVLGAGAVALYVARALRGRRAAPGTVRLPTAGRPLALVRGELEARAADSTHEE